MTYINKQKQNNAASKELTPGPSFFSSDKCLSNQNVR